MRQRYGTLDPFGSPRKDYIQFKYDYINLYESRLIVWTSEWGILEGG
jgi:hypothetical protein